MIENLYNVHPIQEFKIRVNVSIIFYKLNIIISLYLISLQRCKHDKIILFVSRILLGVFMQVEIKYSRIIK